MSFSVKTQRNKLYTTNRYVISLLLHKRTIESTVTMMTFFFIVYTYIKMRKIVFSNNTFSNKKDKLHQRMHHREYHKKTRCHHPDHKDMNKEKEDTKETSTELSHNLKEEKNSENKDWMKQTNQNMLKQMWKEKRDAMALIIFSMET
ncbi:hypothetical protein RFI_35892 [Reticulomyxa filosa]|uniref:Uncharacterized protein n=1 Tax=Reticulomyxa filosa TaxID=46433 RepID=X6LHW3_RETFI|nr:hypothetical protein RFI_35892 [Reticulomyxa filosa]|eukprot:ETO01548.1 hypothetical protein RFI_35892 [Reticulomyxa filosa]